jgi:hypothetical protein
LPNRIQCCKTSETSYHYGFYKSVLFRDAVAIDKDFQIPNIPMPHYGSSYAVQATQLIFKGGLVNKSIEMAGLREQL